MIPKPKETKKEHRRWTLKLDKLVREIIIQRYAKDGYIQCYTCGKVKMVDDIDCGHYISRAFFSHRWNLDNVRPQCRYCNYFRHGEPVRFREKLVQEIGEDRVRTMEATKNKKKPSILWMQYWFSVLKKEAQK